MTPMFFDSPNYTQIPNDFFEKVLPDAGRAELAVTLVLLRETFGYHRRATELLTINDLQARTGLARATVIDGIAKGEKRGYIAKRRVDRGTIYEVHGVRVSEDSSKTEPGVSSKTEPTKVQDLNLGSSKTEPGTNKGKERSKEKGKKTTGEALSVDAILEEVFEAWRVGTGKGAGSKLTPDRRKKLNQRFNECVANQEFGAGDLRSIQGARIELLEAVAGLVGSAWHQREKQTDFTQIFRNSERVQFFRDRGDKEGNKPPDSIYATTKKNPELED